MEEIQKEKEQAGKEERLEKKEPRKLFMRWTLSLWGHNLKTFSLSDGRAFNINEARIPFSLDDSKPDALEVTVQVKVTVTFYLLFKLNKKDGPCYPVIKNIFSKGVQASRHAGASIRSGANLYQVFFYLQICVSNVEILIGTILQVEFALKDISAEIT